MVDVCKWLDIWNSFKQYSSPDIAMKMNIITKTQFNIDDKMEETIIDRCSLKYTVEKDDTTTKKLCHKVNNTKKWLFGNLVLYRLLYFFYNLLTILFFSGEN